MMLRRLVKYPKDLPFEDREVKSQP